MRYKKFSWYIDLALNPPEPMINFDDHSKDSEAFSPQQLKASQQEMQINYTGEICAQALYAGHAQYAQRDDFLSDWLNKAQKEEFRHLEWCGQRLYELNTKPSAFNGFFYFTSYLMAAFLARYQPDYNLAFIAETEKQVHEHLAQQLISLKHDRKSCEIIERMKREEAQHQYHAEQYSRQKIPYWAQHLMRYTAKCMKFIVRRF